MALGESFESVLGAAKSGGDWAWVSIYKELAGPVTGFLRARGVSDPEDATADVFFEISRQIDQFNGTEASFQTFVFEAAYARMRDDRHSDRPPRSRLADRVLDRIRRDAGATDQLETDADTEVVRQAFETLTQEQRDVLSLRVLGGLSVQQTAQVVNSGAATVRAVQRKALARVRFNSAEAGAPS